MAAITIRVQADDFDAARESALLTEGRTDIGAVVSFTGLCRSENGRLSALELEHYPGMAESVMQQIALQASERFGLLGLTAIHRYGRMEPGSNIVLVIAAASHRQAAFDGANYVMDHLKTGAPFWKKEHDLHGKAGGWVDAKDADDSALRRWNK